MHRRNFGSIKGENVKEFKDTKAGPFCIEKPKHINSQNDVTL